MSQEKVDKYKEEKLNRKKDIAKAKRKKKINVLIGVLAGVAFVVWIVYSVFAEIQQAKDEESRAAEISALYEELLQQQATATTGTGTETTTGADEATTGADEATTGSETGTADATKENETTSDKDATTAASTENTSKEEETTKQ